MNPNTPQLPVVSAGFSIANGYQTPPVGGSRSMMILSFCNMVLFVQDMSKCSSPLLDLQERTTNENTLDLVHVNDATEDWSHTSNIWKQHEKNKPIKVIQASLRHSK